MRQRFPRFSPPLFVMSLLLATGMLISQGTTLGIIRGAVTDQQGGAVAGAKVTLTDLSTNLSYETTTDASGNYEMVNLRPGAYKVAVTFQGFNTTEIVDIALVGGGVVRADAKLKPKTLAEAVTVTAEAPLIQTDSPTVSGTLNTKQILDIPRDNRDIYQFLYLNPNITFTTDDGFKFIGSQSYGANFALDGQRATGAGFGQATSSQPSLETIGELTVLSNSFTAEYAGIQNIRLSTRRGEKNYHGSLFYDNKNQALAAWSLDQKSSLATFQPTFATPNFPKPFFNFTEFGGSIGGPVPLARKKTFFMGAFEHRVSVRPIRMTSNSLPHYTVMNGNFTKITDARKPVVPAGVTLSPAELASNTITVAGTVRFVTIPQRLISPFTSALFKAYFPITSVDAPINNTNGRLLDYADTLKSHTGRDLGTVRVDHDFSEKNRMYVTYNISIPDGTTGLVGSPFKSLGTRVFTQSNHTLSVSHNHVFTPGLINEVRGGFNYQNSYRRSRLTVKEFLGSLGFTQGDIDSMGGVIGKVGIESYGQMAMVYGPYAAFPSGGRDADRPLDQQLVTFGDTLTWVKGRHSIRTGFDLVRNHVFDGFTNGRGQVRGRVNYSGSDLNPITRFLMGLPPNTINFNLSLRPPMDVSNWEHGYFLQDDFRIHPRLTLNLGLRYEYISPFIDANDLFVNFDPTNKGLNGNKGVFVIPSERVKSLVDPRMITYGLVTAKDLGLSRGLVRPDRNNVAPRLGAAFRLNDKTSLRGGVGWFFPTAAAQGVRDAMASSPFNQGRTKTSTAAAPLGAWPRPFEGGALPALGGQPTINAVPFGLQLPRITQWNVTFERELGWQTAVRLSYLGTKMDGLILGFDLNMIPPNDTPFGTTTGDGVTVCAPVTNGDCQESAADQARRPFPGLGDFMLSYGNSATGHSNAFQTEVTHRFSKGLMFNAHYTLLDQVNSGVDANSSLGGTVYNQFKPDADTGTDQWVSRHRFVAYGTYELPFGRGRQYLANMNKAAEAVFGGWQTSFQMFVKSGTGFTPWWSCSACGPPYLGNIASNAADGIGQGDFGGSFRAIVTGDPNKKQGDRIWDPSAFGLPSVGADLFDNPKNSTRGFLRGPRSTGVNLSVRKSFQIQERMRLAFTATLDNLFNHPLLAPVGQTGVSFLGTFDPNVDPKTGRLLPIDPNTIVRNPDFGRLRSSFSQEGIDAQRSVRLQLRLTF